MSINAIQASQARSASAVSSSGASQSTNDASTFLQLLVTELKNQDPTKPVDPTQTVTQLATFSSVEQSVKTNSLLATLGANSALSQASSLIGRTVASSDGSVSGLVSSVTIGDSGLVAQLADGQNLALGSGVSIS